MIFNLKLTPEAFVMIPIALILDLAGLAIVIFLLDDLGIIDLIGVCIFFPWLIIRGHRPPSLSGRKSFAKIKKLFKGKYLKFLLPLFGEVTPWLGGLGFFWTMTVFCNLEE
ncbi:MAG: hypothetical protein WC446_01075 [Candidatus Paceibacterota bacterium]|jgi:hypothetical protein